MTGGSAVAMLTTTSDLSEALCGLLFQVSGFWFPVPSRETCISRVERTSGFIHLLALKTKYWFCLSHAPVFIRSRLMLIPCFLQADFNLPSTCFIPSKLQSASRFTILSHPTNFLYFSIWNFQLMWVKIRFLSFAHYFSVVYRSLNISGPLFLICYLQTLRCGVNRPVAKLP